MRGARSDIKPKGGVLCTVGIPANRKIDQPSLVWKGEKEKVIEGKNSSRGAYAVHAMARQRAFISVKY